MRITVRETIKFDCKTGFVIILSFQMCFFLEEAKNNGTSALKLANFSEPGKAKTCGSQYIFQLFNFERNANRLHDRKCAVPRSFTMLKTAPNGSHLWTCQYIFSIGSKFEYFF